MTEYFILFLLSLLSFLISHPQFSKVIKNTRKISAKKKIFHNFYFIYLFFTLLSPFYLLFYMFLFLRYQLEDAKITNVFYCFFLFFFLLSIILFSISFFILLTHFCNFSLFNVFFFSVYFFLSWQYETWKESQNEYVIVFAWLENFSVTDTRLLSSRDTARTGWKRKKYIKEFVKKKKKNYKTQVHGTVYCFKNISSFIIVIIFFIIIFGEWQVWW